MDIVTAEGIQYFEGHLTRAGAYPPAYGSKYWAIHSDLTWSELNLQLDNLSCRHCVGELRLIKTTPMRNTKTNYVFVIIYHEV